jgi:hypothetical protein
MRVNIKAAAEVRRQLRRWHGHAAGFAPSGRRIVAAGGAARPQPARLAGCGPTRNPWKAYEYVGRDEIPASLSRRRNNMPGFHPGLRCLARGRPSPF